MSTATVSTSPAVPERVPASQVLGLLGRHLLSFYFPLLATVFLLTGPHPWWGALLFFVPLDLAFRLEG